MNIHVSESVTIDNYRIQELVFGTEYLTVDEGDLKGHTYQILGFIRDNHGAIVITFGYTTWFLFWKRPWIMVSKPGEQSCFLIPV